MSSESKLIRVGIEGITVLMGNPTDDNDWERHINAVARGTCVECNDDLDSVKSIRDCGQTMRLDHVS